VDFAVFDKENANGVTEQPMNGVRVALPALDVPGSSTQVAIMKAWIEDCDANHSECHGKSNSNTDDKDFPTRLINLNSSEPDKVFIVERPAFLMKDIPADVKYAAFSHPWGNLKEHKHFTSTRGNIVEHMDPQKGINIKDLPSTFRDAIAISRKLGISYL
jgi:hypothetical protein